MQSGFILLWRCLWFVHHLPEVRRPSSQSGQHGGSSDPQQEQAADPHWTRVRNTRRNVVWRVGTWQFKHVQTEQRWSLLVCADRSRSRVLSVLFHVSLLILTLHHYITFSGVSWYSLVCYYSLLLTAKNLPGTISNCHTTGSIPVRPEGSKVKWICVWRRWCWRLEGLLFASVHWLQAVKAGLITYNTA